MALYYGTHPHLERGEFRADIILNEIKTGQTYPDSENISLYKGWRGIDADVFMLSGILKFFGKKQKEENIMISYNEQDWEDERGSTEVVPD